MGECVSDFNIFLLGIFAVLILIVIGMLERPVEWAVFPGMGIVIGAFLTLALLADGSLTTVSGGSTVVIASASTNVTSVWRYLEVTPMIFTFVAFLISVYKVGKGMF